MGKGYLILKGGLEFSKKKRNTVYPSDLEDTQMGVFSGNSRSQGRAGPGKAVGPPWSRGFRVRNRGRCKAEAGLRSAGLWGRSLGPREVEGAPKTGDRRGDRRGDRSIPPFRLTVHLPAEMGGWSR